LLPERKDGYLFHNRREYFFLNNLKPLNMKKIFIFFSIASLCLPGIRSNAQNTFPATGSVGIGTTSPAASSLLEVRSTTKGFLAPRMTLAQRNLIGAPATGLLIYQTDGTAGFYYYYGSGWRQLLYAAGANTSLSNLSTTVAVNRSLVAGANGTLDIGSLTRKWRKGYFSDSVIAGSVTAGASNVTTGVRGTGSSYGVYGSSSSGYGVVGSSGFLGVYGSGSSYGLYGSGGTYGAYASGTSYGVYGSTSSGYGVAGISSSGYGLYGSSSSSWGSVVYGVYGAYGSGTTGYGVQGVSNSNYGVYGYSGSNWAVYGNGYIGTYGNGSYVGAWGNGTSYGLVGYGGPYGVWATGTSYAGYFSGNVYCSGTYSGSDKALKKNIKEFSSAMDIINKLKPRQYEYRHDGNYEQMNLPDGSHYGLIAQDVELILPNLVKDSKFETNIKRPVAARPDKPSPADASSNPAPASSAESETISFKAVNYIELIPILVKAVQELSAENAAIKEELTQLKNGKYSTVNNSALLSDAALLQNTPNPFAANTTISYFLPGKYSSAQIVVYDKAGKKIKEMIVTGAGRGTLKMDAATLSSGTYSYSLVVDGAIAATRQLIIAK
jgi:hypothetical protein